MSGMFLRRVFFFFLMVSLFLSVRAGYGQGQVAPGETPGPVSEKIRIRRLEGLGGRATVKTPEYDTNMPGSATPSAEWVRIRCQYDTAPEWIDELAFTYYAMGVTEVEGKRAYSMYKKTVRYSDIEEGRSHLSVVYLRPKAVERYGELVAVAVEISLGGQVVAVERENESKDLPADWWKNPAVTDAKIVTQRDGYLLNRLETPFAFINYDDYEDIR